MPFLIDDDVFDVYRPLKDVAAKPPVNKIHVRQLDSAVLSALKGHKDTWGVLANDAARDLRSGNGVQFFEKQNKHYKAVHKPSVGNKDWLCLVNDEWVESHYPSQTDTQPSVMHLLSEAAALERAESGADLDDPDANRSNDDAFIGTPIYANRELSLSLTNPDGQPMPDGQYQVEINGQTFAGKLNDQGEALVEQLPEGDATITFEPNEAKLASIRSEIKQQFDGIIDQTIDRKVMLDDLLFENGFFEGYLILGCIFTKSVFDRGVSLGKDTLDAITDAPSALNSAKALIYQAMTELDEEKIKEGFEYLINTAGELKSDVEQVYAVMQLLMSDTEFWRLLMDFIDSYISELSAEDKIKFFGAAVFDIALCFIGVAALAKASTATKSLKTSATAMTALRASKFFSPAVDGIKRIYHIYALQLKPITQKVTIKNTRHDSTGQQQNIQSKLKTKDKTHEKDSPETDTQKPSQCIKDTKTCNDPISTVTGEELFEAIDFNLPGPIPLTWKRVYRSTASAGRSALGYGWSHPWHLLLSIDGNDIRFRSEEGLNYHFTLPEHGETRQHTDGPSITRFNDELTIKHLGQHCIFEPDPSKPDQLRLARISSTDNSQHWQLHYREQALASSHAERSTVRTGDTERNSTSQLIRATSSWGSELIFSWSANGLSKITYRSDKESADKDAQATPLIRYKVNSQGDLIAAKRPNTPAEQYRYQNHLFELRQTPTKARYRFEWDQLTPTAKCTRQYAENDAYDYRFEWDCQPNDQGNQNGQNNNLPEDIRVTTWNKSIDSNGVVEYYGYNNQALLLCHQLGDGSIERNYYDAYQQLIKHKDGEGHTTHLEYDDQQRLIRQTNPLGQATVYNYWNNTQLPAVIKNASGQTLRFRYDNQDRLTHKTYTDGKTERYFYKNDQLIKKVDPQGQVHHYQWHAHWGLLEHYTLLASEKPAGKAPANTLQAVEFNYDDQGQLVSQTDQHGNAQHFVYDEQGQLVTRSNQHNQAEHFKYDAVGRVIAHTDTAGRTTQLHYGVFDQIEARTLPNGSRIEYQFDKERNLTAIINPNGAAHRFEYDACERISKETSVDGRETSYQYNHAGHLIGLKEGDITARFNRDALGQLQSECFEHGHRPELNVINRFNYNSQGQLISANNAHADTDFNYNAHGQLIGEHTTQQFANGNARADSHRHEIHYGYNEQGQLEQLHHKAFKPETQGEFFSFMHRGTHGSIRNSWHQNYQWHDDGQLHALTTTNGRDFTDKHTLVTQHFNDQGQLSVREQGPHLSRYEYDAEQRLRRYQRLNNSKQDNQGIQEQNSPERSTRLLQERQYRYDASGRIETIADQQQGLRNHQYNNIDQLSQVVDSNDHGISESTLQFDPAGNRLPDGIDELLDNRLPFFGDRHFEYDEYGNQITIKRGQHQSIIQNLTYNAKHQLVELTETVYGKHKHTLQFSYDALGRRINKKVLKLEPTKVKVAVPVPETELEAKQKAELGTEQKAETENKTSAKTAAKTKYEIKDTLKHQYSERYVWQGQNLIQTRHLDKMYFVQRDEAYLYTPGSHTPLAIRDSDLGILHLDTDHLGTPKAAYEHDTGEEIWHTEQDVYGKTKRSKTERTHPKTGQAFAVNLRFQGQYEDVETGLYYNLNRYYDPSTGRYINHDPIKTMGGLNLYQYCPNPVEWVDPLGLMTKEDCPKGANPSNSEALFRGMKTNGNEPEVGPSARTLGARPNVDIPVDSNGNVHPGTGGISVAPQTPLNLPTHRRPVEFEGTGKDPVWSIDSDSLGDNLIYIQDKTTHGTIQPSKIMTLDQYQIALSNTKWLML